MTRLTIRIDFANGSSIGPGKIRLLELVEETGSIRKAAAKMRMSYRRAWVLLKGLEAMFGRPLVVVSTGGVRGGGSRLSVQGARLVSRYRRVESLAEAASKAEIRALAKGVSGLDRSRRPLVRQKG